MSESCSLSDTTNIQESLNDSKVGLEADTMEGTIINEVKLLSKEEQLEKVQHEQMNAEIQPLENTYQAKEVKESFAIEPTPNKFENKELTVSVDVNVEQTQNSSLDYSQVEAAIKAENIVQSEATYAVKDDQEKIEIEIESCLPISITKEDYEKAYPLRTNRLETEKSIPTSSSRNVSTTHVSYNIKPR